LADDDLARLGRLVLSGKPLPRQAAARNIDRERCRRAMQGHLFNRWLMARVQDGLLGRCVIGDRLRGRTGEEELVTDPTHAGKRLESWEAVVLGPMFGAGLSPVGGEAERREAELLAAADLTMDHLASLDGHRRAARIQPLKALIDVKSIDLVVTCELPVESSIDAILREIIKDDAKPATADLTQDAEA
jgi:tRNA(Glu) U13 pseudouridine synthase TruD